MEEHHIKIFLFKISYSLVIKNYSTFTSIWFKLKFLLLKIKPNLSAMHFKMLFFNYNFLYKKEALETAKNTKLSCNSQFN